VLKLKKKNNSGAKRLNMQIGSITGNSEERSQGKENDINELDHPPDDIDRKKKNT